MSRVIYLLNLCHESVNRIHFSFEICTTEVRLEEFGVYNLRLKGSECRLETALEPVNANLALLFW